MVISKAGRTKCDEGISTLNGRRFQSGAEFVNATVAFLDFGKSLSPPQFHERAQLLERDPKVRGIMVGLSPGVLHPAVRVVCHQALLGWPPRFKRAWMEMSSPSPFSSPVWDSTEGKRTGQGGKGWGKENKKKGGKGKKGGEY